MELGWKQYLDLDDIELFNVCRSLEHTIKFMKRMGSLGEEIDPYEKILEKVKAFNEK